MAKDDKDLYNYELERYRETLRSSAATALDRYGFTLLNSLNPAERAATLRDIGFELNDAIDFYNLGCHAATEENWSEAIVHFKRAVDIDPDMTAAYYNLALCYEKTGHVPQAKATWNVYLSASDNEDERSRIESHVAELEA
ncbi:MAG: tetratricopeptide repeat protein [Sumerlaeia bacterium]